MPIIIKRLSRPRVTLQPPPVADLREKTEKETVEGLSLKERGRYADTVKHLRKAYENIMQKLYNPKHRDYKEFRERKIEMAECWKGKPKLFVHDVIRGCGLQPTPDHSLDRWPDNNSGYKPGNLRWATKAEQAANRRPTKTVTIDGIEVARPALARAVGLPPATLGARMRREAARADPYVSEFEANWNTRVKDKYGRPAVRFSNAQKDEVIRARARLDTETDLIKASTATLMYWREFTEDAEIDDGLFNVPAMPKLEFFLKHLETAVMFHHRKRCELIELRERPKRRERCVREFLKWRNGLAEDGHDPGDPDLYGPLDPNFDMDLYEKLKPEFGF